MMRGKFFQKGNYKCTLQERSEIAHISETCQLTMQHSARGNKHTVVTPSDHNQPTQDTCLAGFYLKINVHPFFFILLLN